MNEPAVMRRKLWEFSFIAESLSRRGYLEQGRSGVGFGVGEEPLSALFVSRGCCVLATDIDPSDPASQAWRSTGQHASLDMLNREGIATPAEFAARAEFRHVDMNHIPPDLGVFDFAWSACALEHLGSIDAGLRFIANSAQHLKPGGVAVHTTEFNVDSNDRTVEDGPTVLFRRQDIERLDKLLLTVGCYLVPVDYSVGDLPYDRHVDAPPYGLPHLKLTIGDYTATSIGLIVLRGS